MGVVYTNTASSCPLAAVLVSVFPVFTLLSGLSLLSLLSLSCRWLTHDSPSLLPLSPHHTPHRRDPSEREEALQEFSHLSRYSGLMLHSLKRTAPTPFPPPAHPLQRNVGPHISQTRTSCVARGVSQSCSSSISDLCSMVEMCVSGMVGWRLLCVGRFTLPLVV